MYPETAFDQIVARARAGDAAAWADLYDEVGGLVVGYLRSQRLPDPEDVAGEVFLQMVRDIHRFDGDREKFRSWVLSIAHNRLVDDRRRARRRPSTPVDPEDLRSTPTAGEDAPEHELLRRVVTDEIEGRLAQLTEEQRTVVMLRVIGDLSLKECAEVMGKRVGAIKGLQHRAVEALRRDLGVAPPAQGAANAPDVRGTPARPSSDPSA